MAAGYYSHIGLVTVLLSVNLFFDVGNLYNYVVDQLKLIFIR